MFLMDPVIFFVVGKMIGRVSYGLSPRPRTFFPGLFCVTYSRDIRMAAFFGRPGQFPALRREFRPGVNLQI